MYVLLELSVPRVRGGDGKVTSKLNLKLELESEYTYSSDGEGHARSCQLGVALTGNILSKADTALLEDSSV